MIDIHSPRMMFERYPLTSLICSLVIIGLLLTSQLITCAKIQEFDKTYIDGKINTIDDGLKDLKTELSEIKELKETLQQGVGYLKNAEVSKLVIELNRFNNNFEKNQEKFSKGLEELGKINKKIEEIFPSSTRDWEGPFDPKDNKPK